MPISNTIAKERILTEFHEWSIFQAEKVESNGIEFLLFQIPTPKSAQVTAGLEIEIGNGEVTVFFDYYHTHFDEFMGDDEYNIGLDAAIALIRGIITEKVVIVSWWMDEKWRGSSKIKVGQCSTPNLEIQPYNRTRIRSWTGKYNTPDATKY